MPILQPHHIVDLYCAVDSYMPKKTKGSGRPPALEESEVLTILLWHTLTLKQATLKDIYSAACLYHRKDFPRLPTYQTFVEECHRAVPHMFTLLGELLCNQETIRLMDATMLEVCKLHRVDSYKVAPHMARFGRNWQGWHFGFKLHTSISLKGELCGLALTGANVYDAQMMVKILNQHCKVAIGDTLYGAKVMGGIIKERYGTVIIATPHPTQKKKIATPWQLFLLNARSKIESVFDYLKNHLHLVSSFPRSMAGYLVHYVRVLLAYQIGVLGCNTRLQ